MTCACPGRHCGFSRHHVPCSWPGKGTHSLGCSRGSTMGIHDLESRVGKLERSLSGFAQELRLALRYIQHDAGSSLTKSRVVLEKILITAYSLEMGQEPRKPLLGDMLADNQF